MNLFSEDFYLNKAGLAAHFEKEWSDLLLNPEKINFKFAAFEKRHLTQSDTGLVSKMITELVQTMGLLPKSYLEIGPGLGRAFYEIHKKTPSLQKAQLVEPSKYLADILENIFLGNTSCRVPLIFGNDHLSEVEVDPAEIRELVRDSKLEIIKQPFHKVARTLEPSDLVLCLNVVDQTKNPEALLRLVKEKTKPNGLLIVSCTYLWQKKYPWSKGAPFTDLRSQFDDGWEVLKEENIPFSIRVQERYWYTFLSQVLYLKRKSADPHL